MQTADYAAQLAALAAKETELRDTLAALADARTKIERQLDQLRADRIRVHARRLLARGVHTTVGELADAGVDLAEARRVLDALVTAGVAIPAGPNAYRLPTVSRV